jgi:hypothetical protein
MSSESVINQYVLMESRVNGGHFLLFDEKTQKPLALDPKTFSNKGLLCSSGDIAFVCTQMRGRDGLLYDIDFFINTKQGREELDTVQVHAIDGKERYTWVQKGDIWKQQPL